MNLFLTCLAECGFVKYYLNSQNFFSVKQTKSCLLFIAVERQRERYDLRTKTVTSRCGAKFI